jgi:DNA-binding transcriptional ArsR family regulator
MVRTWTRIAARAGGRDPDPAQEALVRFFRALGNPGRLTVLKRLLEGERSVGEIVAETGIPQAQVSNALACLRWCGFVRARPEGRRVFYAVTSEAVRDLLRLAEAAVAEHAAELYTCTVLAREAEAGPEA